jgi:cytochrome b subunit of formate dehydrogenase
MINMSILVITGFALKFPEAFWASPIADVPMGMTFRGFLHRLSGIAILTLSGYHVLYLIFTERGRRIAWDMIPWLKDARDFWETLKNNLFINRPAKELKMGRFNFREKAEYLALIWGTIVMTATGFILWFKETWLMFFPMWTFDAARAIHLYEAILATLAIIVWHFYAVIFNPEVYPMNWAWITGYLTEHEMELEHGLELQKIKAKQNGKLADFSEAVPYGGGRIIPMPMHREDRKEKDKKEESRKEPFSFKQFYGSVRDFNESIKRWEGN